MYEKEIIHCGSSIQIKRYARNGWQKTSTHYYFKGDKRFEKIEKVLESMYMYKTETRYYIVK